MQALDAHAYHDAPPFQLPALCSHFVDLAARVLHGRVRLQGDRAQGGGSKRLKRGLTGRQTGPSSTAERWQASSPFQAPITCLEHAGMTLFLVQAMPLQQIPAQSLMPPQHQNQHQHQPFMPYQHQHQHQPFMPMQHCSSSTLLAVRDP